MQTTFEVADKRAAELGEELRGVAAEAKAARINLRTIEERQTGIAIAFVQAMVAGERTPEDTKFALMLNGVSSADVDRIWARGRQLAEGLGECPNCERDRSGDNLAGPPTWCAACNVDDGSGAPIAGGAL